MYLLVKLGGIIRGIRSKRNEIINIGVFTGYNAVRKAGIESNLHNRAFGSQMMVLCACLAKVSLMHHRDIHLTF